MTHPEQNLTYVDFDLTVEAATVAGLHNEAVRLISFMIDESVMMEGVHFSLKNIRPERQLELDEQVLSIDVWKADVAGTIVYDTYVAEQMENDGSDSVSE